MAVLEMVDKQYLEANELDTFNLEGKVYVVHPETDGCKGCDFANDFGCTDIRAPFCSESATGTGFIFKEVK